MRSAPRTRQVPDTNLAESLQRITGISIERRDGEGAQVTAWLWSAVQHGHAQWSLDARRRCIRCLRAGGHRRVDGSTRAFNFAQLAAGHSIEVYKTSQAQVPSGHRRDDQHPTSRPLDHAGIVANAGQSCHRPSQPF
jgi:hypothetical protein